MPDELDAASPLVLLTHLSTDMGHAFARYVGVSLSRMELLHELMHSGEISQTELAQRLTMETSLVTRFAKQMEAEQLIARRVDPKDNRFTLVSLAPAGEQLMQKLEALGAEFERRLLDGLNAQQLNQLASLLEVMQRNLDTWDDAKN